MAIVALKGRKEGKGCLSIEVLQIRKNEQTLHRAYTHTGCCNEKHTTLENLGEKI